MLYIPPNLAYGERGMSARDKSKGAARQIIGLNQTPIFEVELLSVLSPEEENQE